MITLKELAKELGQSPQILANTLRPQKMSESWLNAESILNVEQIDFLRKRFTVISESRKTSKVNIKSKQYPMPKNVKPYSIADLSQKFNRSLADAINIVKMLHLFSGRELTPDTVLDSNSWDIIVQRLSDKRIRLNKLAQELGVSKGRLVAYALELQLIETNSLNQRVDKEVEEILRKDKEKILNYSLIDNYMKYIDSYHGEDKVTNVSFNSQNGLNVNYMKEKSKEKEDKISINELSALLNMSEGRIKNIISFYYSNSFDDVNMIPSWIKDELWGWFSKNGNEKLADRLTDMYITPNKLHWTMQNPCPENGEVTVIDKDNNKNMIIVMDINGSYGFIVIPKFGLKIQGLSSDEYNVGDTIEAEVHCIYSKKIGTFTYLIAEYRPCDISDPDELLGLQSPEDFSKLTEKQEECNWEDTEEIFETGLLFEAHIDSVNDGGFIMNIEGSDGEWFCPKSKAPTFIDEDIREQFEEETWLCELVEDKENDGFIVNAKLNPNLYKDFIDVGGYYSAIVCYCNDYGAQVMVDYRIPLFMPNKYIDWNTNNNAITDLELGGILPIKVIQGKDGSIIASQRDAIATSWNVVQKYYNVGSKIKDCKIIEIKESGVYLKVFKDIRGFLPVKEISWIETYTDAREANVSDDVTVIVTDFDDKHKCIIVSLRRLVSDPWDKIDELYPDKNETEAIITSCTKTGAYLQIGVQHFHGYLSYRETDWLKEIHQDNFPYKDGDTIRLQIICKDKESRKLLCSVKRLKHNPWEDLENHDTVLGTVKEVKEDCAHIQLYNGIECICKEKLNLEMCGGEYEFEIQELNPHSQKIVLSYRKHEITNRNILAVGEMFKEYRNLSNDEKGIDFLKPNTNLEGKCHEDDIRYFTVKEISSTGRVITSKDEDKEFEKGVLLPTAVTVNGISANIIFARYIIKNYLRVGEKYQFKVVGSYANVPFAVLSFDACDLLHINEISLSDLNSLHIGKKVFVRTFDNVDSAQNLFVEWRGYIGYVPRSEVIEYLKDGTPDTIELGVASEVKGPEQLIRFTCPSLDDNKEEEVNKKQIEYLVDKLSGEQRDIYNEVQKIPGFNLKNPDDYPSQILLRYDPDKFPEITTYINNRTGDFQKDNFFMNCYENKRNEVHLTFFNLSFVIEVKVSKTENFDNEFYVCGFERLLEGETYNERTSGRLLKIKVENLSIVSLNSGALPPDRQNIDNILLQLKYLREVEWRLNKLSTVYQRERGKHYLTLKKLLQMELDKEKRLAQQTVEITKRKFDNHSGNNGICLMFDDINEQFDKILTADDDLITGVSVFVKINDGTSFSQTPYKDSDVRKCRLKKMFDGKWLIDIFRNNEDIDPEIASKHGLLIKRNPNVYHLIIQMQAIESFVSERDGFDILSKIDDGKIPLPKSVDYEIIHNSKIDINNPKDSQANALKMALGESPVTLIQGPPGTGKSTVICDIVRNLVKQGKKVLVCTQSIAPVEELYHKLREMVVDDVTNKKLRCAYLRDDESIEKSSDVKERALNIKNVMLLLKDLRKNHEIKIAEQQSLDGDTLNNAETLYGLNCSTVNKIYNIFRDIEDKQYLDIIEVLKDYHNALTREDVESYNEKNDVLQKDSFDVVFGTCIGVGVSPHLKDIHFDTLILDEAGKANYSETLVPMMKASQYILVGDDKQLPPFTNSEIIKEMANENLSQRAIQTDIEYENYVLKQIEESKSIYNDVGKSLFSDLSSKLPDKCKVLLNKQFRMHPNIGNFVSNLFYDGKIESIPTASERTIAISGLDSPIIFNDTTDMGFDARECRKGTSLYNQGEIDVIREQYADILKGAKISGRKIGILSPYGAQVLELKKALAKYGLADDIFTIDSIQGEEYDIVVFSFVRNTRYGRLDFIDNLNRLNVSFSRARCNLILVGHLETLTNEKLHVEDKDKVMAIYKAIDKHSIKHISTPGGIATLQKDFPDSLKTEIDKPYCEFLNCKYNYHGNFWTRYKNKNLEGYIPILRGRRTEKGEAINIYFLGFNGDKPYFVPEPLSLWMQEQWEIDKFSFTGTVQSLYDGNLKLSLKDGSIIELQCPNTFKAEQNEQLCVSVRINGYKKKIFTLQKKYSDD